MKTVCTFWPPLSRVERAMIVLFVCAASLFLIGCDMRPEHAEWQNQCVSSHTEMMPIPQYVSNGQGGGTTIITFMPYEQCDQYVPVCVAGKDGSTECKA